MKHFKDVINGARGQKQKLYHRGGGRKMIVGWKGKTNLMQTMIDYTQFVYMQRCNDLSLDVSFYVHSIFIAKLLGMIKGVISGKF